MSNLKTAFILVASLAALSPAAQAAPGDLGQNETDRMIEVRTGAQLGDHAPRMIIAIEHNSNNSGKIDSPLCSEEVCYLSVKAEVAMSFENGTEVPAFYFDFVPVEHVPTGLRMMRTQVRRDLDLGEDLSVSIYGLGWETETTRASGLGNYARMAVDVLGLQYLNAAERGTFTGVSVAQIETEIGAYIPVDFSDDFGMTVKVVYIGVAMDMGVASVNGTEEWTFNHKQYSSFEVAFRTAYGTFGVFFEGGQRSNETLGEDASSGYDYMNFGISGAW